MNKRMRCPEHSRYRGKGKPQRNCIQCWGVWLSNPYAFRWMELSINEMRQIMLLLGGHI